VSEREMSTAPTFSSSWSVVRAPTMGTQVNRSCSMSQRRATCGGGGAFLVGDGADLVEDLPAPLGEVVLLEGGVEEPVDLAAVGLDDAAGFAAEPPGAQTQLRDARPRRPEVRVLHAGGCGPSNQ
jgi:hypothetical protein